MMQQYLALKARVPEALLLFRLGDFYEMFLEDAERAAPLLDLLLTTRDRDAPDPVPMCGLPVHALEGYVRKLLQAGHSVAIAEQVEDPQQAKGLVRRDIVEVVTPGLVANPDRLEGSAANYLAAVCDAWVAVPDAVRFGLAYLDVSTGEYARAEITDAAVLAAELERIAPREVLVPETLKALPGGRTLHPVPPADFDPAIVHERVGRLPEGLAVGSDAPDMQAAAAIWAAVARLQPFALEHLHRVRAYAASDRLLVDGQTRRHLELVCNVRDGGAHGTLLAEIDHTRTPMGRRRLAQWLGAPLVDPDAIRGRQDRIASWLEPDSRRRGLADALRGIGDLERSLTRACLPSAGPRELAGLRDALGQVAQVDEVAPLERGASSGYAALASELARLIVDSPPAPTRGEAFVGYVCDGVDAEVDRIRKDSEEANGFLANFEAREREHTGISALRLKYNRVFGYSIEVSRAQASKAPEHYRRKQTTANAERFTTDELEHWEGVVLRGREQAAAAEADVLLRARGSVGAKVDSLRALADEIAALDVAQALASLARERDYVRPEVDRSLAIDIEAGRHPVVERFVNDGFVPNDVHLDPESAQLVVLTGPNMAGKSTLLRQVALIVLLAQMGSFVPARRARIGVADRIFTRVGASDSLATGESTFMVEMRETATILAEATPRSLVVLDEIGRGTSTFDGLSIAWAVAEHLHDAPGLHPRSLFATHYHELADLARTKPRVRNFHFAVSENKGEVLFLRRLEPGAASRSYGIEVGRRAGLPPEVVGRAREVLANLEGGEFDERGRPRIARAGPAHGGRGGGDGRGAGQQIPLQMALFDPATDPLRDALRALEPERMTPLEALVELDRLRKLVEEGE